MTFISGLILRSEITILSEFHRGKIFLKSEEEFRSESEIRKEIIEYFIWLKSCFKQAIKISCSVRVELNGWKKFVCFNLLSFNFWRLTQVKLNWKWYPRRKEQKIKRRRYQKILPLNNAWNNTRNDANCPQIRKEIR